MKLRNNFTILAVYSVVIGLAFVFATARMRAQNNAAASAAPAASASPTPAPSLKPSFSLSTNRTYGSNDRAKIYVNYQGIDALDFRIYKVKDPAKFFKQLNDPHRMGEDEFQTNDAVSEVKESKPGVLEKVHDFKTSVWNVVKNYFRKQLQHESRVEFNVKFRGLGGESDRLPLNVADFARMPLLNQDQLVTSFRQKLATDNKYDSKMVIMDKREPGVYLIEAVNSATGKDLRAYTIAIVTDLTMVYKTSDDGEMLVYTVDRKSGNIVTYLNGIVANATKMDGTSIRDAGSIVTGLPATIGQDPTGSYGETGSGDMDDLGVWKKVLTPLEVAAIYTAARSNNLSFVNLPVSLSLQNLGGNQLQLTWPTGTLQSADNPSGPYTDLPAATSPFVLATTATQKFYRIKL